MKAFGHVLLVLVINSLIECIPILNVPNTWVFDIETNQTESAGHNPLRITCSGYQNLTWKTMVHEYYYTVYTNITSSGRYYSTLEIEEPVSDDTGLFTCLNENQESASTYIYVFDGKNGFVSNKKHETLEVTIGEEITLDCRTTHPKIKVSVFKDGIQNVTSQFHNDQLYRFHKVAEVSQETGIYSCVEDTFKGEITWLVNVEPVKVIRMPSIERCVNCYYVAGMDFSLNCSVPIDKGHPPQLEWILPNSKTIAEQKSFTFDESEFQFPNIIRTLTVKNPSPRDSGEYTCISKLDKLTGNHSIQIDIPSNLPPFVEFTTPQNIPSYISVNAGENATWILEFIAYPKSVTYQFYDNFGQKLIPDGEKIKSYYMYDQGILALQITNITAEAFGNYSAVLRHSTGEIDTRWTMFVVNATPKVVIEKKSESFYRVSQNISLRANILAFNFKQPAVFWWFYYDCPNGINSCNRQNRKNLNQTLQKGNGPPNRYKSISSIEAINSGIIECEVRNDFGFASEEIPFVVYDKRRDFFISFSSEIGTSYWHVNNGPLKSFSVIEGDRISVKCFSLDFLYRGLKLKSEEPYFNCSSDLSSGKCFDINNLNLSKELNFDCSAVSRATGRREKISAQITVKAKKAPELLRNSNVTLEGETVVVKSGKPFNLSCFVEGTPVPKITWWKDGVNIEEIPDFVDNKERVFLLQNKQVLEFKFAHKDYKGQYICNAENRVGSMSSYATLVVEGAEFSTLHWMVVALGVLFIGVLSLVVLGLMFRVRKESRLRNELRQNQLYLFEKGNIGDLNTECTIDEQADLLPYDKSFEVEKERIKLGKQLGFGAFGRVMLAEVDGLETDKKKTKVAVKMCKDGADMAHLRALTLELKIMVHLGKHLNIVNLMGAYTSNMKRGDLWILVEYCKYGNILKFIQSHKSHFVNQIDSLTGCVDPLAILQTSTDSSITRYSQGRTPNFDTDGYLENKSQKYPKRFVRNLSNASSFHSSQSSRPGFYVDNPSYTSVSLSQEDPSKSTEPSTPKSKTGPNVGSYVLASHFPLPKSASRHPSVTSDRSSEEVYHPTFNTEFTDLSSPPPQFSPKSTVSGEFSFDSQGNVCPGDSGVVPGVTVPLTTMDLICWSWQVANGMEYLSRRKVLHGDLAARNLLLAENNVVKISDFGLSRDIYKKDVYMKKGDEIMPIKWMAPEAIQQKVFSIQSDVWAFGVTMWELFTLGNNPYPGVPLNQEFTKALENGMRMEKPKYATQELYSLMLRCWDSNPVERPNFTILADQLSQMLSPESRENYVSMNDHYVRRNAEWMEFKDDYLNMVTTPDFQNMSMANDHGYIEMQNMNSLSNGPAEMPTSPGYLDMNVVVTNPQVTCNSIFSPRPQDVKDGENVFTFPEAEHPALTEDQQSPRETSSLLDKSSDLPFNLEGSTVNESSSQPFNENNNVVGKLNNFNQLQDGLYQNIDCVSVEKDGQDIENHPLSSDKTNHTVIILGGQENSPRNYVNTTDVC